MLILNDRGSLFSRSTILKAHPSRRHFKVFDEPLSIPSHW